MMKTHQAHRMSTTAAFLLAAAIALAATPTQVRVELLDDARHRAIFCGNEGTETSAAYGQTLARDLKRLEAAGRTTAQSLEYVRARACDSSHR